MKRSVYIFKYICHTFIAFEIKNNLIGIMEIENIIR